MSSERTTLLTRKSLFGFSLIALSAVYLFAKAPPPLADEAFGRPDGEEVPVARLFETINLMNAASRKIYTRRIVGAGKKAGLKFGEDWDEDGVHKGPLPALFLRLVASKLEAKPVPIGLYLGSDEPINPSNLFTGEQAERFKQVKADKAPQIFAVAGGRQVAMYPDPASVQACVTCHNEHADTPKKDWVLNDIMGATTWTYPAAKLTQRELNDAVAAVYAAIGEAYDEYVQRLSKLEPDLEVAQEWPHEATPRLPDRESFMAAVFEKTAEPVLERLLLKRIASK